jgi:hypothetical protein
MVSHPVHIPRKFFTKAIALSNVLALEDRKLHTLLSGMSFFRVKQSIVGNVQNRQVLKMNIERKSEC